MNNTFPFLLIILLSGQIISLVSCNSNLSQESEIATDSTSVAQGKELFNQTCTACHAFEQDGIGPALGGITTEVSADWLKKFIKDPKTAIESGDERAKSLFEQYKSVMPSFAYFKDEEIDAVIAYMHTQKKPEKSVVSVGETKPLENPIPEGITPSGIVLAIAPFKRMPSTSEEKPLTRITKFYARADTKDLWVLDLRGKLYRLRGNKTEVYMDMASLVPRFINKPGHATGFGSFAFHPQFPENGLLYTTHTEGPGSAPADFQYEDSLGVKLQWVLSEWTAGQPSRFPFDGKGRELLRVNMVGQSHGVQEITFNPLAKPGDEDYGLLYVGIGDGGSAERGILHINKGPENIWSSIIRIDPQGSNSANKKYGIPASNPFVNSTDKKALGEIYAYGFRNPHRISWTRSGKMLTSNIGQHHIEELNLIRPGHDYGWPMREGSFVIRLKESTRNLYPLAADDRTNNFTYPVAEYDHDEGNAIVGGYEYFGSTVPRLQGKYIFGDMVNGRLFYVNVADLELGKRTPIQEFQLSVNGNLTTMKKLCDDERLSMRLGQDHEGEMYISTMPDGQVYKIVDASQHAANVQ